MISGAHSRGVFTGQGIVLDLAVVATTSTQSCKASCKEPQTTARARISSAPAARAVTSAEGNILGFTRYKFRCPIFFMARAAAPMFPRCVEYSITKGRLV